MAERKLYILRDFFSPLRYITKSNHIDREEVRAQLQKFQHAKVDRPAVPPYVTCFAASATLKEKKKGKREREKERRKNMRVTFSFRATTKAPFPLLSPTSRPEASNEPRQGKLPLLSTQCEDCHESFSKSSWKTE